MVSTLQHLEQSTDIIHSKSRLNLKPGKKKTQKKSKKNPKKTQTNKPTKQPPKQANLHRIYLELTNTVCNSSTELAVKMDVT